MLVVELLHWMVMFLNLLEPYLEVRWFDGSNKLFRSNI